METKSLNFEQMENVEGGWRCAAAASAMVISSVALIGLTGGAGAALLWGAGHLITTVGAWDQCRHLLE